MAKQKRDNDYYLDVLARKHPAIYADYLAGRFRSTSAAFIAAGIRKPPKAIHALMRAWKGASHAEQREFLEWIKAEIPAKKAGRSPPEPITTSEGYLTESAKRRIRALYPGSSFPNAAIMTAIGWPNRHDSSLGLALSTGSRLRNADLRAKLEVWLPEEEARRKATK